MDDLLREFVTETNESLDVVDNELVRFEQEPSNKQILDRVFRLVHTIKGTCGFLNLPRLEALAHAAEHVMGKFRDGPAATPEAVALILQTIDRIKEILATIDREQREPEGDDSELINQLHGLASSISEPSKPKPAAGASDPAQTVGKLVHQVLERPLRPGEDSLDELERAFRETSVEAPAENEAPVASKDDVATAASKDDVAAQAAASQTLRVPVDTLEHLMTMVSELVLTRNQLLEISRQHEESEFKNPLQRLSNVTAQLQEGVMKTRMQPIGNAWQKLPRIVRDLASELGKRIELELHGAETELDRQVLDLIKDPLTHMVRNSADHGLETMAERRAAGKPERGCIRLGAYHEGGQIVIEIADDGRGLNTDKIKAKVIAQGLATGPELAKLSEAQIHKFIFAPGFSTATQVTNISGRGVGMDVVRNNIHQIGGTIDVRSVSGAGVSFIIKIPLTLAIVSALIVEAGGERFAIPQLSVSELVRLRAGGEHRIERIKNTTVLRLRDRLLPIARLTDQLGLTHLDEPLHGDGFIVVIEFGSQSFGVVVDSVFHTEEIVVKPMSRKLRNIAMFSGNTILGDGSVIMIVDPKGIAQSLGNTVATQLAADEAAASAQAQKPVAAGELTSLLVFRAGSQQPKAVPLAVITRLEEIDVNAIELSNGRYMVQYRGHLMPLIGMSEDVRIKGEGAQPLLVFSDGHRSMALIVDEIVDIIEDRLEVEVASSSPGVIGSAIIKGQATEIVDVGHFVPLAFADWFRGAKEGYSESRKPSVLLVDDSPFFLNMLVPVLQAAGYQVTPAAGGREAFDSFGRAAFDLVVTDIDMPEMDGFALAEKLRTSERGATLPIIGLSSTASLEGVERARAAGFYDIVAKFDRQGLLAALNERAHVGHAA